MVISDLAEVALPRARWRLVEASCALCGYDEIQLRDDEIICARCEWPICVLCGCVEIYACTDGCSWIAPGICSTHEGDIRLASLSIPTSSTSAAVGLLN